MTRVAVWVGLVLAGCHDPPPPRRALVVADAAVAPGGPIAPPDRVVRDLATSERGALAFIEETGRRGVCRALREQDRGALRPWLTDDFRGAWVAEGPTTALGADLARAIHPPSPAPLEAEAFIAGWWRFVGDLARVERCTFKPSRFLIDADAPQRAWAEIAMAVGGRLPDGRRSMRRATWRLALRARAEGGWVLAGVDAGPLEVVAGQPTFVDVGDPIGVGLRLDARTRDRIRAEVDQSARTHLGGLAVTDWDADGFEDLLAWTQGHSLTLFRNDGAGGFVPRDDLLPAAAVGDALLVLDLDADGVDEVVTSEVVGCAGGVARLGLYRRVDGGLEAVPAGLPFAARCEALRGADLRAGTGLSLQHFAPADADGDGDLDLLVTGYSTGRSFGPGFNYFQADDGARNLLFLNEGGLRFREVGAERGLTATRYSYVAGWIDLDGDGDRDLFVGNDYGVDSVYLNDGAARFSARPDHPLATSGWSMGLAVADLDQDGALDVSLSRMYSTAGHRIVPLTAGRLSDATRRAALGAAAGNAVFSPDGEGGWREHAKPMGLHKAGWAWGQAVADLDGDGDPDLLVVNGMTSHSTHKEADY